VLTHAAYQTNSLFAVLPLTEVRMGDIILGHTSYLDAFSTYYNQT